MPVSRTKKIDAELPTPLSNCTSGLLNKLPEPVLYLPPCDVYKSKIRNAPGGYDLAKHEVDFNQMRFTASLQCLESSWGCAFKGNEAPATSTHLEKHHVLVTLKDELEGAFQLINVSQHLYKNRLGHFKGFHL